MNQPPKKRRLFSFSRRTLFVFILALCLMFGFIAMRLQRAREQQAFLRELGESQWLCEFADNRFSYSLPGLWELAIDSNYFDRISIVFYNGGVDGEEDLNLTPLLELRNIHILNVSNTQLSELTPVAGLKNLEHLDVSETQVSDLTPLAELEKLEYIDVEKTQVSDLTPLAKLKNLRELALRNTQVADLSPLVELKNLAWLDVSKTQVSDKQIQQLQRALPYCHIVR